MSNAGRRASLVGRDRELDALRVSARAAAEDGATLLLVGDPGVGKTALLEAAVEIANADGFRVLRCGGAEYETDVSFAGLHQLLGPLFDDVRRLTPAMRTALEVALGIGDGPTPERLAVMNAALELLRLAATRQRLVVVVDDMQWLDRATGSVVGFMGRRLAGTRIWLLGATRPGAGGFFERAGLPELLVGPLDERDALALVTHQFAHLPTRVLREVVVEAEGNPLALLEFAASAAGRESVQGSSTSAVGREVRALYETRISALPADTRGLLLLAALDASGSLAVLAAASNGTSLDALAPAERDHLIVIDDRAGLLKFRHPMIRSVAVELSTHAERRSAHKRLADYVADQPERRGYHLAEAADEPDEQTAAAVEDGAHATLRRGDVVGAVTRLLRAADLSPERAARSRRLADAAYVGAHSAGQLADASRLLRDASRDDPSLVDTLHAAVATAYLLLNGEGEADTAHGLLRAAIEAALSEPDLDRDGLNEALYTLVLLCHYSGRPEHWVSFHMAMDRLAPHAPSDVEILASTFADPLTASPAALAALDEEIRRTQDTADVDVIIRTAIGAFYTDRLAGCRAALERVVHDGEDGGAVGSAMRALLVIAFDDLDRGRWSAAEQEVADATAMCREHGYEVYEWTGRYGLALLAANRGDVEVCADICAAMADWATPRQLGRLVDWSHHSFARSAVGACDFETGYAHASAISPAGTLASHNPQALWAALDLVDAAVHTGRSDEARAHAVAIRNANLARLSPRYAMVASATAAMTTDGNDAVDLFNHALAVPGTSNWPFDLARVQFAYGERLRRLQRLREARAQLTLARDGFTRLGARPWVERAAVELQATGRTRHAAVGGRQPSLTPQELEVVRLAAAGLTNREIAARLYLSPRTVSSHLYRAFPKLGVTTRASLRDALSAAPAETSVNAPH